MFGLFKRKDWKPEVLPEIQGTYDGLSVTVRNFPCLRDANAGTRTYRTSNFGKDFLQTVTRQLGDYTDLRRVLGAGAGKTVVVSLPDLPTIQVSLSGFAPISDRQLDSNLADALIDAFEAQGIQP